jgi:hypothetical protein
MTFSGPCHQDSTEEKRKVEVATSTFADGAIPAGDLTLFSQFQRSFNVQGISQVIRRIKISSHGTSIAQLSSH